MRMQMVYNEEQFVFLYESLATAFQERLRLQDGQATPVVQNGAGDKTAINGERSPKAPRLSRGLRGLLTDIRSRSVSRRRGLQKDSENSESVGSPLSSASKGKIP